MLTCQRNLESSLVKVSSQTPMLVTNVDFKWPRRFRYEFQMATLGNQVKTMLGRRSSPAARKEGRKDFTGVRQQACR